MKYKCIKCGFIHNGELPDGYFCPLCLENYKSFELITEEEIKYNRTNILSDNVSINRIEEKCVNCGVCTKTCINNVGIKYDSTKCDGICINCGQCILSCPYAALTPKYDYQKVMEYINNQEYKVIALTSPACRVGIGDAFGYNPGEFLEGKMVSALKELGFNYVFDTTFGADITSVEEAHELLERIENNKLPMYSSCCPSWVRYASIYHPEILPNLSTCKSPIGAAATAIKKIFTIGEEVKQDKLIIVALTPCTSKKEEIINTDTDFVITTSELALMIREYNIDFNSLQDKDFDKVKGSASGVIYGTSAGVTISVLRCLYYEVTGKDLPNNLIKIENKDYYKLIKIKIKDRILKCIIIYNMKNIERLLEDKIEYDFVEVMNCNNGCISGGGQVLTPIKDRENISLARSNSLKAKDKSPKLRYPYKNDLIEDLYDTYLDYPGSDKSKQYLHTKHKDLSYLLENKKEI